MSFGFGLRRDSVALGSSTVAAVAFGSHFRSRRNVAYLLAWSRNAVKINVRFVFSFLRASWYTLRSATSLRATFCNAAADTKGSNLPFAAHCINIGYPPKQVLPFQMHSRFWPIPEHQAPPMSVLGCLVGTVSNDLPLLIQTPGMATGIVAMPKPSNLTPPRPRLPSPCAPISAPSRPLDDWPR
ncbi:hypothetical protein SAMN04488042_103132 [Shimia aestuarii]|uniref:Uncharacterized protein n=1 Tax=Shimia aestuarii TaxID=254406 RepID=A0A1I4MLA4_9RHOB|nr:hypothetical protein SAMN04488042_103132 [Shimia aestuarii]